MRNDTRVPELDGLRAIAVLSVIGFHYVPVSYMRFTGLSLGWAGVDLFFVLSGFLITGILLHTKSSPRYFRIFYARRAFRIFPAYFVVLTIYTVTTLVFAQKKGGFYLPLQWAFLTSLFPKLCAHLPVSNPAFVVHGLGVLWSLSIEELFYLIWAPLVRFTDAKHLKYILLLIIAAAPIIRYVVHQPGMFYEYFFFPARMDALAMGSLVACLVTEYRTPGNIARRSAACAGILTAVAIGYLLTVDWKGISNPVRGETVQQTIGFAVLGYSILALWFAAVVACAVLNTGGNWLNGLRWKGLRGVGEVSYVMYLIHAPVRSGIEYVVKNVLNANSAFAKLSIPIFAFLLSLGIARFSWMYFERPLLRLKDRMFPKTPDTSAPPRITGLAAGVGLQS